MIQFKEWLPKAEEKLQKELKEVQGQKEKAMANAVHAQIRDFCAQDEEFAQAVVQGGSFADCMKAVAKGVGAYISDLEAYKKAVQFYFPGAEVKMALTIDLIGAAAEEQEIREDAPKTISLSLFDFLG